MEVCDQMTEGPSQRNQEQATMTGSFMNSIIQPQPHTFTLSSHNIAALVGIHMLYDVCTMENHLAMYF